MTCSVIDVGAERPCGARTQGTLVVTFEDDEVDLEVCGTHRDFMMGVFTPYPSLTRRPWREMTTAMDNDRRNRNIPRYPERRAHAFRSPWPKADMTRCEACGVAWAEHPDCPNAPHRDDCSLCGFAPELPGGR